MKKSILFLSLTFMLNFSFGQLLPTGTSTTDNKYRLGGLAIGYPSLPSFGLNKFLVNGNSYFIGNIGVGNFSPTSKLHLLDGDFRIENGKIYNNFTPFNSPLMVDGVDVYGYYSGKSILLASNDRLNFSMVRNDGLINSTFEIGMCHNNSTWVPNSIKGDVVLRSKSSNYIFYSERGGSYKFVIGDELNNIQPTTKMIINKNGSVGIGIGDFPINSNDLLAVNGLVHAKEVKVDLLGWPDYVFQKDYKLIPLDDLEKEIENCGHLPNVPSAKEVEENGVNLGEMNKKLLEKVEELTLYIIQLNKEIENLKNKIN